MTTMRLSKYSKYSVFLLATLLVSACQPPSPRDNQQLSQDSEQTSSPITIDADSVTMSSDYILNIKPSRYQPSLGLQGTIEPNQQSRFVTTRDISVQKVLVKEGQWVEDGAPLLLLQQRVGNNKATPSNSEANPEQSTATKKSSAEQVSDDIKESKKASKQKDKANDGSVSNANNKLNEATTDESKTDDGIKKNPIAETSVNASVAIDANVDDNKPNDAQDQDIANSQQSTQPPIVVYASFSGRVDTLYVENMQQVAAGKPLLRLSNDKDLRFTATLPMQAESQLSVGQTVNFIAKDVSETFTGQVSKLSTSQQQPDELMVSVSVVKNEASRDKLKLGMQVTGRVDYGQIAVGNIVPEQAIQDVDLSSLKTPPYQPLTPLTANVWIIKQNQRLTRQPIDVIKYDPSTGKYLIAGISNDSLICLADLPIESVGKKVVIS